MTVIISRFDLSCAQAHFVGSNRSDCVVPLKLQKPTIAVGHSLRMCPQHRAYLFDQFNSKLPMYLGQTDPEAEMSKRIIYYSLISTNRGQKVCRLTCKPGLTCTGLNTPCMTVCFTSIGAMTKGQEYV